jgi:hypothetical protein
MSLANIQGRLSRTEMKNIMAGSDGCSSKPCTLYDGATGLTYPGYCGFSNPGLICECVTTYGVYLPPEGQQSHCVA